jgi:hypothetical protein
MNTQETFYAIFSTDKNQIKILFKANSVSHAKSIKTKFAKKNNISFVQGGKAYTLPFIGENISQYKFIN